MYMYMYCTVLGLHVFLPSGILGSSRIDYLQLWYILYNGIDAYLLSTGISKQYIYAYVLYTVCNTVYMHMYMYMYVHVHVVRVYTMYYVLCICHVCTVCMYVLYVYIYVCYVCTMMCTTCVYMYSDIRTCTFFFSNIFYLEYSLCLDE